MKSIKISEENRQQIQAVITATEVGTQSGARDIGDLFSACHRAEEAMNHEIAYGERAGAVLNIYPEKERTGTSVSLIRRKTGWFLAKIWRGRGTVAASGTRLILPPDARDFGRRI